MIKFVYFDVGGVLEIDLNADNGWQRMKRDIGIGPTEDSKFDNLFTRFEVEVCIGREIDEIVPVIRKNFKLNLPDDYSFFNDMLKRFTVNKSIWTVVDEINKNCKVGLITNMYPRMLESINKKGILPNVSWDVVIDSSVERLQKPNIEIFELAEKKSGYKGKEILFIDNSQKNLDGASKLNWLTFLYNPKTPEYSSLKLLKYFNANVK